MAAAPYRCSFWHQKLFNHLLPSFLFRLSLYYGALSGGVPGKGLGLSMVTKEASDPGSSNNVAVLFDFDGTVGDTVRKECLESILDG